MGRTVLVFGLIAGVLMVCLQWIIYPLCYHGYITFDNSTYVGYAGMLIVFSMIFFGIMSYRDNQGKGSVTFWKGVQIGLLITLLASVIHAVGGQMYNFVNPDFKEFFIQKYTEHLESGLSHPPPQEEIDAVRQNIETLRMIYENPLLDFIVSTIFILPVGVIVTVISSLLLRRGEQIADAEENGVP